MQSTSTKIAYLKRMLRRLEDEKKRIDQLVSSGELSQQASVIAKQLTTKRRDQLMAQLKDLES